ncbi:MAG: YaiI/YqxD family protein [Candidatus Melainabacteria bacterium]|nr:YaiI/YqxD family protein [Candidatus Melainabacteria bacterium]
MIIWVDADACPGPVRDIILRASRRLKVKTIFVANKQLYLGQSDNVSHIQVEQGPDVVDAYIVSQAVSGDFVITQDIVLAAQLINNGISVLSPRGTLYTPDNIANHLAQRDLLQELRDQGEILGGPSPFNEKIKRQFANHFDAELHRLLSSTENRFD